MFHAAPLTMSSREIAELCDKGHKNVMANIRTMFDALEMPDERSAECYPISLTLTDISYIAFSNIGH